MSSTSASPPIFWVGVDHSAWLGEVRNPVNTTNQPLDDAPRAGGATAAAAHEGSTEQYLERLSAVGLVRRREDGGVDVLVDPPFGFPPGSRVIRKRMQGFLQAVTERVIDGDPEDEDRAAILKPLRLTREDYGQMVAEIAAVVDRFATIAGSRISRERGRDWMLAIACGPAPATDAGEADISSLDRVDGESS